MANQKLKLITKDPFWTKVEENKKRWNELLSASKLLLENHLKVEAYNVEQRVNHEVSVFCQHHNISLIKINNKIIKTNNKIT
jgi:hypothetical protein